MLDSRDEIVRWVHAGAVPRERYADALRIAGVTPSGAQWRVFLERLLTWLGAALIAAALVYFIAANWQALGRYAKFALVEGALVAALAIACWRGLDTTVGRAVLFVAAMLMGVLLALVGQVYQTGADTFELFVAWALAIAVWVAVSRQPALWLLLLVLVDFAIVLYFRTSAARGMDVELFSFSSKPALWFVFALDMVALAAWEWRSASQRGWLDVRWAPRAIATIAGAIVTWLLVWDIVEFEQRGIGWSWLPYVLWVAAMYWAYRVRMRDLFMLSGVVLSAVIVVAFALGRPALEKGGAGGFLLIGLVLVLCGAAGGYWLRQVAADERRTI